MRVDRGAFEFSVTKGPLHTRAQHFPSNLYPYPDHNHQHRPMPTHSMTCAHPCYSNCAHVFKICVMCITRINKSWLDQTNKRSFTVVGFSPEHFLVSVFPASEKFDSDLELDAGMHKIDAHPWTITLHPCPPKTHGYGWAWAWVWAPNVGFASHTNETESPHRYTSSTLIGEKGGASPSLLHTTLEGPITEYVNARWMSKSMWIPTWHRMGHISWSLGRFSKTTSWR
jgi:hypothetical protein